MRPLSPRTLVVLECLLLASWAWAQEPPGPRDTAQAAPVAIPAPEIPRRAVQELTLLAARRTRLAPDTAIIEVGGRMPALVATIPEPPSDSLLATLTLFQLQGLREQRAPLLAQLDRWLGQLEARSQGLSALADTLRQVRHTWRVTRDSAEQRETPSAVRERIGSVLATADSASQELDRRAVQVLTILDQVSVQTSQLRETLGRIQAAESTARTRLFDPDSPPLWKVTIHAAGDTSLAARIAIVWRTRAAIVGGFVAGNWPRVGFHVLVFLAVLAILLAVRGGMPPAAADDPSLRAAVHVLHHPFAAAALLVLLATGQFYETLPFAVVSLLIIAALFIVVWVLRGLVPAWQRAPLYGLAALVLFERERLVAPEGTLLHRLLLFATTAAAASAFAWFVTAQRREVAAPHVWRVVTVILARGAVVLLGISLLANVLGLVMLAELLSSGVIWSAAFALLLTAGVLIAHGVIAIGLRTGFAQRLQLVRRHEQSITLTTRRSLRFLAAAWWTVLALDVFDVFHPLSTAAMGFLNRSRSLGSMEFRLGDWLLFAVTIWAAVWLSRIIRYLLDEDVLPRLELQRGVADLVSALTRYSLLGLGTLIALGAAGIELTQLAFVAGALGVGIGFGLQNIVSNFVAGLVLLFERPIQAGDIIELENLFGEVRRIGVRSSTVRTFQGAEVIVPNASLITTNVVNWTLSDRLRRMEINVGVAYGSDPTRVKEILIEVAKSHPEVLAEPAPLALFEGFGESSLDFSIRCWTGAFDRFLAIRSDIRTGIHAALLDAGITIPFPQRDLHIKSVAPEAGATLRHVGQEDA